MVGKIQLFWEGHKNGPYGFEIYLVNVKTIRTIAQIFVAFSEKLKFNEVKKSICESVDKFVSNFHDMYFLFRSNGN